MAEMKDRLLKMKKKKADYIITPRAENDIDEILLFIAADNLKSSFNFHERLNRFELLAKKRTSDGNAPK